MFDQILLIDDSIMFQRLVQVQSDWSGIDLQIASRGEEGIEKAIRLQPAVILLDVDMPDMDGFAVFEKLKQHERTKDIPVIFLTGDALSGDQARAIQLGACGYLTKPCDVATVERAVRKILHHQHVAEDNGMQNARTGLKTQLYLKEQLFQMESFAKRSNQKMFCISIEIDEFDSVQRKHGQRAADLLTCVVAETLRQKSQSSHIVCHNGTGRFAIAGPGDRVFATHMAKNLREVLLDLKVHFGGTALSTKCSFGIADTAITGGKSLLARANGTLRRACSIGEATVCIARRPRNAEESESPVTAAA